MKIYAHRGFSGKFVEGTRTAYEAAIEIGADGMECDIRLTRDGELICFHDRTLERLAGKDGIVSRMTINEIQERFDVLKFDELMDIAIKGMVDLLVETKHPVRTGGKVERKVIAALEARAQEINEAGIRILIMSFSFLVVLRARRRYPHVGYVVKKPWRLRFIPTNIVALGFWLVDKKPELLEKLRDKEVLVWTLNEVEDLQRAKSLGLTEIITNFPDRALEVFRS